MTCSRVTVTDINRILFPLRVLNSVPGNAKFDGNTDRTPFRHRQGAASTPALIHTYPEFDFDMTAVSQTLSQLYEDTIFSASSRASANALSPGSQPSLAVQSVAASGTGLASSTPAASNNTSDSSAHQSPLLKSSSQCGVFSGTMYNWVARVLVDQYELGASFSILILLGKPADIPEDEATWRSSPMYVGGHHVFIQTVETQGEDSHHHREHIVEGYIHLDRAIARNAPSLGSLDPRVIVPYLKENLQWRVQNSQGSAVGLDQLPSLEITVAATPLTLEPDTQLPTPGETCFYPEITAGRRGGARAA